MTAHATTTDLDTTDAYVAAVALRAPAAGGLIALDPLERRHEPDLWHARRANEWSPVAIDCGSPESCACRLDWAVTSAETDRSARFTVIRRFGRAIGSTSYHAIDVEHRRIEIGRTRLARNEWRRGANVEAKLLMLERAFWLGFCRIEFKANAQNVRSRRALEALPASFEGVMPKHRLVRGEERDSADYSVVDDDWPRVRANLARRLADPRACCAAGDADHGSAASSSSGVDFDPPQGTCDNQ